MSTRNLQNYFRYVADLKFTIIKNPLKEILYSVRYNKPPLTNEIIYVDTDKVNYLTFPRFGYTYSSDESYIKGGKWDVNILKKDIYFLFDYLGDNYKRPRSERFSLKRYLLPLDKYIFYTCSKKHLQDDLPWEETKIYEYFIDKIEEGVEITRFETEKQVNKQLSYFDSLYRDIKYHGYKAQKELNKDKRGSLNRIKNRKPSQEVLVNIGRHGDIFFEDGRHRFVIAKILGLDKFPVRVMVRHEKWQQVRENGLRGDTEVNHPDLM